MNKTIDPFDELAAMFLSAPSPMAPPGSVRPEAPARSSSGESSDGIAASMQAPIELVMLGNLPVRGSLWLTPFADVVARQSGPAALIRLDLDEPSLQLLRGPHAWSTVPLGASLQSAIGAVAAGVRSWMVRAPLGGLCKDHVASGVDQITILSSADEAAVVSSYQLVKEFSQFACQPGEHAPRICVAVLGAEAQAAATVVERLNRTTLSFLGAEVRLRACLPRMDAGVRSTRFASFSGSDRPSVGDVVAWIRDAQSQSASAATRPETPSVSAVRPEPRPQENRPTVSAASPSSGGDPRPRPSIHNLDFQVTPPRSLADSAEARGSEHTLRHFIQGASDAERTPAPAPAVATAFHHDQAMRLAPRPALEIEPKEDSAVREPAERGLPVSLTSHIAGLTPLPVRCPDHERVELAVRADGQLHLLTRDAAQAGLRDLRIVEAWAKAHAELIGMACPQHKINPAIAAAWHLFSDQPSNLADLHRTGVNLHVLAPVTVNGQLGWYAAPLNTPNRR